MVIMKVPDPYWYLAERWQDTSLMPAHLNWKGTTPAFLDAYLQKGWYRARHEMFTTHFLHFNHTLFDAIWLRIDLKSFTLRPTQKKLQRKGGRFIMSIRPYRFHSSIEQLYQKYRHWVAIQVAEDLNQLLGDEEQNFDCWMICLYDGEKLVATGLFDRGAESVAGIASFFDPDYHRYSLGKLLALLKLDFCKQQGYRYFYPGYIAPGFSKFNYKLEFCQFATEWYDAINDHWKPWHLFQLDQTPLYQALQALRKQKEIWETAGIECRLIAYRFFDAALWFETLEPLIHYPLLLFIPHQIRKDSMEVYYFDYNRRTCKSILVKPVYHLCNENDHPVMLLENSILASVS